jgi:Translation initiation factor IF-2, N-terminal region
MRNTVRVYRLAIALGVEPARILAVCRQAGIDVKNSVSSLTSAQREIIVRMLGGDGPDGGAGKTAPVRRPPPTGGAAIET